MQQHLYQISITNLLWALLPVGIVLAIFKRWSLDTTPTLHGMARMVSQLIIIGYALTYVFSTDQPLLVMIILCVMVTMAGLIAMRPLRKDKKTYLKAIIAIVVGSTITLIIISRGVIQLTPWYNPRYLIPLAGMIFSTAMNAVSLGAERFTAEIDLGKDYIEARSQALKTSLIPITNSLFAVGLVSLPGMMTGQILSGVSPLIAVRYQIMVMCMVYSSAGISTALYLHLHKKTVLIPSKN